MKVFRNIATVIAIFCVVFAFVMGLSFIIHNRPIEVASGVVGSQPYPSPEILESSSPTPTIELPLASQRYLPPGEEIATKVSIVKPPSCQFDTFSRIDVEAIKPKLEFSEPKVMLTNQGAIGIVSWLPDNNRILIVSDTPLGGQTIEIVNVQTLDKQLFGERNNTGSKPVWLNNKQAVAFTTFFDNHEEILLSDGNPEKIEQIYPNAIGLSLSSDSKRLLFLTPSTGGYPQILEPESGLIQSLPLNLKEWEYPRGTLSASGVSTTLMFQTAWSPDGTKVIFYTNPWIFMYDNLTGQICEIDLGGADYPRWAFNVQWSPDGRYLSLLTTTSGPGTLYAASDLILLDLTNGQQQIIRFAPELSPSQHYVTDVAWKNDGSYLMALAVLRLPESGGSEEGLFLIDPSTGAFQQINMSISLGGGTSGWQLDWSDDGSQIAVNCPTQEQGRLCLISVETKKE
jgi:Tol biopolymer transport system component